MKLYVFGSCSGTEPMEGRHHTSLAIEVNGRLYWFDAGENCSHTAHLMGLDLLSVSDIFISHTHMDHVGGLGNLLWNIRKLSGVKNKLPSYGKVQVYIPNLATFDAILTILKNTEGNYKTEYETLAKQISDSTLLKNDDIEVIARHNFHLPQRENEWQSFSFRITAGEKKIIYSADIKSLEDMKEFLEEGCDLLIMETGHHKAEDVCQKIVDSGYRVENLYFLHHGRSVLNDFEGSEKRCQSIFPKVRFCNDGDVFDLESL